MQALPGAVMPWRRAGPAHHGARRGQAQPPAGVTTDNQGRIYTADYENGSGTAPADLFVFGPDGKLAASRVASEVYGPFGIVVAGAMLPCGAYKP